MQCFVSLIFSETKITSVNAGLYELERQKTNLEDALSRHYLIRICLKGRYRINQVVQNKSTLLRTLEAKFRTISKRNINQYYQ